MDIILKTSNAAELWEVYWNNLDFFSNRLVPIKKFKDEAQTVLYLTMGYDDTQFPYFTLKDKTSFLGGYECESFEEFEKYLIEFSNFRTIAA